MNPDCKQWTHIDAVKGCYLKDTIKTAFIRSMGRTSGEECIDPKKNKRIPPGGCFIQSNVDYDGRNLPGMPVGAGSEFICADLLG